MKIYGGISIGEDEKENQSKKTALPEVAMIQQLPQG